MENSKLPQTQEELEALLEQVRIEASQKTASQTAKMIEDLEAEVALKGKNPHEFPRIVTEKNEVYEFPYLNPVVIKISKNDEGVNVTNTHLTDDEKCIATFGVKSKELLKKIFDHNKGLFVKK